MDDAWITITLVIFGAAGLLGSAAFSKWYDKCRYHFFRIMLLLVVPLSWKLGAVGCLLLLLWSDHPSSLLLLGSPVLCVGHNPEALWLS